MELQNQNRLALLDCYYYLDNIPMYISNPQKYTSKIFDEYNLSGARLSAKTTSITIMIAKTIAVAIASGKLVAFYCARKYSKQVPELCNEIKTALDEFEIPYDFVSKSGSSAYAMFSFPSNKSFVSVVGITNSSNTSNMKGIAKCFDFDLAIDWFEEANEMNTKDFQDLRFAIRGAKKEIHFTSCNPDLVHQDHIKYLNTGAPFNLQYLKAYGQQLSPFIKKLSNGKETSVLNHYTNYKINTYLSEDKVNALVELAKVDPIKAVPWVFGFPGSLSGTIFGEYLGRSRREQNFMARNYYIGLDFGISEAPTAHPTAMILVGADANNSTFQAVAEYYHDNLDGKHKDRTTINTELVMCVKNWATLYRIDGTISVQCDYGGGGIVLIEMLNKTIVALREQSTNEQDRNILSRIYFEGVDKEVWYIKDRIDATHILLSTEKLGINEKQTPNLLRQMSMMIYKENNTKTSFKVEPLDKDDDCWDALCYAIMPLLKETLHNINPLIRKGNW